MKTVLALLMVFSALAAQVREAHAAETCGDGVDNDSDGLADEGCMPSLTTGVCESPYDCETTGAVSPIEGILTYPLPTDLAPNVPYGPPIKFRRFYTSGYSPGLGAPAYRKPLGPRWQHPYMSWLDKNTVPNPDQVILHTLNGQDVLFKYTNTSSGWDYYAPQSGFHAAYLRQKTSGAKQWELRTLNGWTLEYSWSTPTGKLTKIKDSLATPNVVTIAYDGAGQVSTVTDASGTRRLLFGYGGGQLTSVTFQTITSGTPTSHVASTYAYTSGNLASASIAGTLVQTNSYSGTGLLTMVEDGSGIDIVGVNYVDGTNKVARIDSTEGTLGFEYNSSRSTCSGQTALYFNAPSVMTCDDDSDCAGAGADYMCGGETNPALANTGVCFLAGRCLTVTSPSEDLVTSVSPLAPASNSCDGACTDIAEYFWDTAGAALNLRGIRDPANNWRSATYNANGLPTLIAVGDTDSDPTNAGSGIQTWYFYANPGVPGRVTEIRSKSERPGTCSSTDTSSCKRTILTYNANGLLQSLQELGYTWDASDTWVPYDYVTSYVYDTKGRLTSIDGPLAGSNDVVLMEYWTSTDSWKNGFLQRQKRKKDAVNFLITEATTYDYWGYPTTIVDPDGTLTCRTYHPSRGRLTSERETMAGQLSCTANPLDLVSTWTRDTANRMITYQRPSGGCIHYAYDSLGRLEIEKRRDDCNASSVGDTVVYTYFHGDRLSKIETTDATGAVTRRQEYTYYESLRLKGVRDPVSLAAAALYYDARGLIVLTEAPMGLEKRGSVFDAQRRKTQDQRYTSALDHDDWTITYLNLRLPIRTEDEDAKITYTTRDDMGRLIRLTTPDGGASLLLRDAAGRLVTRINAAGTAEQQTNTYSYDNANRQLSENYMGGCNANPEFEYVFDSPPVTCPPGADCQNTQGRIAYVRSTLTCGAYPDNALDQETFYSYDAAGRMVTEYIRDDSGRIAIQRFSWTADGELSQVITPSSSFLGSTFDGPSNSDGNLPRTVWRGTFFSPVIDSIEWYPFGDLKSYRHQNLLLGQPMQTKIGRDLAHRVTDVTVEASVGGADAFKVLISEDAMGRVTGRDYTTSGPTGPRDSFFEYDMMGRLVCEKTTATGSCPTSGSSLKNNISGSPPYTASDDRREFLHAIPGSSSTSHVVNLASGKDQIASVNQVGSLGVTNYVWNMRGQRESEDNPSLGFDDRYYDYDPRGNVRYVQSVSSSGSYDIVATQSYFDHKNRRVYKDVIHLFSGQHSNWFFYYDATDRLTEIVHTPDLASPSTYSLYQITWLNDRVVAYFQTDYPSGTLSRRYAHTDENGRIIEMYSWPASGDGAPVWLLDPDAWGNDSILLGSSVFQPLVFAGQYRDPETAASLLPGVHRPALVLNGFRTYDPFTGTYLQVDPAVDKTLSPYAYVGHNPVGRSDIDGQMMLLSRKSGCEGCRYVPREGECYQACNDAWGCGGRGCDGIPGGGGESWAGGGSGWGSQGRGGGLGDGGDGECTGLGEWGGHHGCWSEGYGWEDTWGRHPPPHLIADTNLDGIEGNECLRPGLVGNCQPGVHYCERLWNDYIANDCYFLGEDGLRSDRQCRYTSDRTTERCQRCNEIGWLIFNDKRYGNCVGFWPRGLQ